MHYLCKSVTVAANAVHVGEVQMKVDQKCPFTAQLKVQ